MVVVFSLSCVRLWWPHGLCSPLGSSVHRIFQIRILEWVANFFSRGSSLPKDQTQVSCTAGRFVINWTTREVSSYSAIKRSKELRTAMTRMNRENMLTERSKTTYCMIPFIWNAQNKQIHRGKKINTGCQRLGETGRDEKVTAAGYKASFIGDENVLELGTGNGCTALWIY